jgi:hypothetical protein
MKKLNQIERITFDHYLNIQSTLCSCSRNNDFYSFSFNAEKDCRTYFIAQSALKFLDVTFDVYE